MQQLILASSSKQRKLIMDSLGIPYIAIPAELDEKEIRDADLKVRAKKLAQEKAQKIFSLHNGVVIAADTFNVCGNNILEKPHSIDEAYAMLKLQSGSNGTTYTGFCYIDPANNIDFSTTVISQYTFRQLTDKEIKTFVSSHPVLSWSAGFSPAYTYQLTFIANLNGSLTGFTHGLPVELLVPLLYKSGFEINPPIKADF